MIKINGNNLTYSGTDTLVFIILPNTTPIVLGSLTTLSHSSYRIKRPISTIGGIVTKGVAKGGRTIAGTMVFTLINQNWVNELLDVVPWLKDKTGGIVYSDELPLFDLMVVSASEYGKYVSMWIYGVGLTDEAQVISVNDLYTENTFSFIAREVRPYSNKEISKGDITYYSNKNFNSLKINALSWGISSSSGNKSSSIDYSVIDYGKSIAKAQGQLKLGGYDIHATGYIDTDTKNALIDLMNKLDIRDMSISSFIDKVLNVADIDSLFDNTYKASNSIIAYSSPNKNEGVTQGKFDKGDRVLVFSKSEIPDIATGEITTYFFTEKGWVKKTDLYDYSKEEVEPILVKDVLIGNDSIIEAIDDTNSITLEMTLDDFFNDFNLSIEGEIGCSFLSNISYYDKESRKWSNSIKKEYIESNKLVYFSDRKYIIPCLDLELPIYVIISSEMSNLSYLLKINFKEV